MRILLTGANGQLGTDVFNCLDNKKDELIATDIADKGNYDCKYYKLDITSIEDVKKVIEEIRPDGIIHTAAYTAVDKAESEKELAYKINTIGTRNLCEAIKNSDCKFLYISTDYVFNGLGDKPWSADSKEYAPINVYGKTKLEGELEVSSLLSKYFIVRTAWVFGKYGNNFVKTMINLSKKYESIKVVNDQIGSPTYTKDLARLILKMIHSDKYGYYHATNSGEYISWFEFAKEIFKQANININVIPVSTSEYGISVAKRPFNSRLDKTKLITNGFGLLPDYKDALNRYLKEIEVI